MILRAFFGFPNECQFIECQFWGKFRYTVIAKRNVGALTEDTSKAPYKALFNSSTNTYSLINAVIFMREIERYLQTRKNKIPEERLVCIHANRFIVHLVLLEIHNQESFNTAVMDINDKKSKDAIVSLVDSYVKQTTQCINKLYPDSYPANIFKNTTKCKNIANAIYNEDQKGKCFL